jgi:hypothetical protein
MASLNPLSVAEIQEYLKLDYNVVTAGEHMELTRKVNELITFGYVPIGGVTAAMIDPNSLVLFQAMLKQRKV